MYVCILSRCLAVVVCTCDGQCDGKNNSEQLSGYVSETEKRCVKTKHIPYIIVAPRLNLL